MKPAIARMPTGAASGRRRRGTQRSLPCPPPPKASAELTLVPSRQHTVWNALGAAPSRAVSPSGGLLPSMAQCGSGSTSGRQKTPKRKPRYPPAAAPVFLPPVAPYLPEPFSKSPAVPLLPISLRPISSIPLSPRSLLTLFPTPFPHLPAHRSLCAFV